MKFTEKLRVFFPPLNVCIYYMLSSLGFCYIYFHRTFYNLTFYENNVGGIYNILSFEAVKPNQFRLLIPFIFKLCKTVFFVFHDRVVFFMIILLISFFVLVIFYNILNVYFADRSINRWLAMILFYPMIWHYIILNEMFEFTDFANLLFILAGFYFIIKEYHKLLLLTYLAGTFNHDSTGFLIVMFILFNIKTIFRWKFFSYILIMAAISILVKLMLEKIFASNPGLSFRINYIYNTNEFFNKPLHIVFRSIFLIFGGMHLFVFYFIISGKWKKFNTKYFYISFTIIPYVIIIYFIHTLFEARNYITAIPFIVIPFLLYFTTEKNSFLKPADAVLSRKKTGSDAS